MYESFLNKLTTANIRKICTYFNKHVKIVTTKKSREELINHLLTHTLYDKQGNISVRHSSIGNVKEANMKEQKKPVKQVNK